MQEKVKAPTKANKNEFVSSNISSRAKENRVDVGKGNKSNKAPRKRGDQKQRIDFSRLQPNELERLFSLAERSVFGIPSSSTEATKDSSADVLENFSRLSVSDSNPGKSEENLGVKAHSTGSEPSNPHNSIKAKMEMQPQPPADPKLAFIQKCQADSEALLKRCPPHLAHVKQTYLRQAEAFNLADQCNAGLPELPAPDILVSTVTEVPSLRPTVAVLSTVPCTSTDSKGDAVTATCGVKHASERNEENADGNASNIELGKARNMVEFCFSSTLEYGSTLLEQRRLPSEAQKTPEEEKDKTAKSRTLREIQERYLAALQMVNNGRTHSIRVDEGSPTEVQTPRESTMARPLNNASAGANRPSVHNPSQAEEHVGVTNVAEPVAPADATLSGRRDEVIRVFCVEQANDRTGAFFRTFVATSYASAWQSYLASPPSQLHWYEVVREGRPCHLYFDLEFARGPDLNANVNGDALVNVLLDHVQSLMARNWSIHIDLVQHVYELDSSTGEKFSRHIIVRLPHHAFLNNFVVGQFVAQVLAAAGKDLYVDKKGGAPGERLSFVDVAVYTRNRHFRLVYSCKGGKSAVLRPTERFAGAQGSLRPSPAQFFLDTLICNVDPSTTLLLVRPLDITPHYNGGNKLEAIHSGDIAVLGPSGERLVTWKRRAYDEDPGSEARGKELRASAEAAVSFVERVASQRAGLPARARTVAFCGYDGTVAYSMIGPGSHHCENIGRAHKNNHVYFVLDFSTGRYSQKCHDPDCSRFRSEWMPLPAELWAMTELVGDGSREKSGQDLVVPMSNNKRKRLDSTKPAAAPSESDAAASFVDDIRGRLLGDEPSLSDFDYRLLDDLPEEVKEAARKGAFVLQKAISSLQDAIEETRRLVKADHGGVEPLARPESPIQDIIGYAHKLSFTAGPPVGFLPGRSSLGLFKPPAPQEVDLRGSVLHSFDREYVMAMTKAQRAAAYVSGAEKPTAAKTTEKVVPPPVSSAPQQGLSLAEILSNVPEMPVGWKPGDPIPGLPVPPTVLVEATLQPHLRDAELKQPEQPVAKPPIIVPEGPIGRPMAGAFDFALNPDLELVFEASESESESDSE